MSIEAVRKHLEKYGLDSKIREFKESTAQLRKQQKLILVSQLE